jgi:hypothetical protein
MRAVAPSLVAPKAMDLEAVAMTKPRDLTELPAVESRALSARNVIRARKTISDGIWGAGDRFE